MSDTDNSRADYKEVDFLDVLLPTFSEGKGVITLQSGMTNAQIAFTIRQAASLSSGKAFTVIPPADLTVPAQDQLSRDLIVTALQALHRERVSAWNSADRYAADRGLLAPEKALFGIDDVGESLRLLGAAPV